MTTPVHIDLLRHGQTEAGARFCGTTDVPLSAAGWEQMWAAVAHDAGWSAIYSSPLARCAAFARALGQQLALPVTVDERLQEMDFGAWEGRTAADLQQIDPVALGRFWQDPWRYPPPRGEPMGALQARVLSAWHDIAARGRPALLISHGGPVRVILSYLAEHPPERLLDIDVPLASRVRVALTTGKPVVASSLP